MSTKLFWSADGREWMVTKVGSFLTVAGDMKEGEKLYEVARSCAQKLGVATTRSGMPLEHLNEHRRIWSTIWERGVERLPMVPGRVNA